MARKWDGSFTTVQNAGSLQRKVSSGRIEMLQREKWPFRPMRLSEIIDRDTLAVIEAGCAERLGRAMTIIDYDADEQPNQRTDPINKRLHFAPFCRLLRDESRIRGGEAACEACDLEMARAFRQHRSPAPYHEFACHMGLCDAAHVVQVGRHPVAVLLAGQFQSPHGATTVQRHVNEMESRQRRPITLLDAQAKPELLTLAAQLTVAPPDFRTHMAREAHHLQRIAEAEHQRIKTLWEQEFLDQLRAMLHFEVTTDMGVIRQQTEFLLRQVQSFCRCSYLVLFANIQEKDTVLAPIAQVGLPPNHQGNLPHFNWKKAGLPLDHTRLKQVGLTHLSSVAPRGIRGDNSSFFIDAELVQPTTLGQIFRSVLIFGPFAERIDLQEEQPFLAEISRTIGNYALTELQVLSLQQREKQWESTAKLLTHQVRTALTPITTQVGMAKVLLQRPPSEPTNKLVASSLKGAHELCLRLGKTVDETVQAHILLLEPEDMKFEPFPLSVLVTNCVDAFIPEVERRQRQLFLDENIEQLPQAEVDIARLTIALSNLIDNAVKYSFPNTKIVVRGIIPGASRQAGSALDLDHVLIEIQDEGDEIAPELQQQIFEQGARGLTGAKLRRIPGTGLGLWEARAVIEAHGGAITLRSTPTSTFFKQMRAHRVSFRVKLPLRHGDTGKASEGKSSR